MKATSKATSNPPEPGAHVMRAQTPDQIPKEYEYLTRKSTARFDRDARATAARTKMAQRGKQRMAPEQT